MKEEEEENAFWKRQVDIVQLQSRITELEAENNKLREVLTIASLALDFYPSEDKGLLNDTKIMLKQSLKPKENE